MNQWRNHLCRHPMAIWFISVGCFYVFWVLFLTLQNLWVEVVEYWPIAFSMALGSYAAGSTPMGGGTVGFPVLVFLFDYPPSLGRDFSFAVQSVGMVSASIFIFCRKQYVHWPILIGAMIGAVIGTPLGLLVIAPWIDDIVAKFIFAIIWASFGVLHFYRINEICSHTTDHIAHKNLALSLGFFTGLVSSLFIVSVTGVGIDMLIYMLLILYFKSDLKIAIPTSVIIMAVTSLVGISHQALTSNIDGNVLLNWLAAAPIVIFGAPLGVFAVEKIGRKITLLIIGFLCVLQFFWVGYTEYENIGLKGLLVACLCILLCILLCEILRYWGSKRAYWRV